MEIKDFLNDTLLCDKNDVLEYGVKRIEFKLFNRTFRFETLIKGKKPPRITEPFSKEQKYINDKLKSLHQDYVKDCNKETLIHDALLYTLDLQNENKNITPLDYKVKSLEEGNRYQTALGIIGSNHSNIRTKFITDGTDISSKES